ncbi:MAG: c-type cytochrome [Candidatus Jettenia sp. CY-1]|nr:MAG: c-type cytochrome [Candidatus Jettenia sp. CY-1]
MKNKRRRDSFFLSFTIFLSLFLSVTNITFVSASEKKTLTKEERVEMGKRLFETKQCSYCHNGENVKKGKVPDLERWKELSSPVLWAAIMWNHVPEMVKAFTEERKGIPKFEKDELIYIFEFLNSSDEKNAKIKFPGNASRGAFLFSFLGCKTCHSINGEGGSVGPSLSDGSKYGGGVLRFAGQLLSHAPYMSDKIEMQKMYWPMLQGNEIAHLFEYFKSVSD